MLSVLFAACDKSKDPKAELMDTFLGVWRETSAALVNCNDPSNNRPPAISTGLTFTLTPSNFSVSNYRITIETNSYIFSFNENRTVLTLIGYSEQSHPCNPGASFTNLFRPPQASAPVTSTFGAFGGCQIVRTFENDKNKDPLEKN